MAKHDPNDTGMLNLPTPTTKLPTVVLTTPSHYGLVTRGLEAEAARLKKLAKDNEACNYHRNAREVKADATAIEQDIIPRFKPDFQFELASEGELRAGIMNMFSEEVKRRAKSPDDDAKVKVDHAKLLLESIAARVTTFALAVAEEAYQAGLRARADTSEGFAVRNLKHLRGAVAP